jgi:hypothetical protein
LKQGNSPNNVISAAMEKRFNMEDPGRTCWCRPENPCSEL